MTSSKGPLAAITESDDEARYGFRWGQLVVRRTSQLADNRCLTVYTDAGQSIDIYCSPTGRSLRVFGKGRGEMRAS